jgi:hypothetical protein
MSNLVPRVQQINTNMNVPGGVGLGLGKFSKFLLKNTAQGLGLSLADLLAQTAGQPGQSKMSGLGISGPAPEYNNPYRNMRQGNTEKKNTQKGFADLRGSITPGSSQPAASNLGEGASMDAAERFRPGAGYPMGVIRPDDYPVLSKEPEKTPGASAKTGPKLDPNATERFKTAFNAGNNNMDQIQAMYADGPKYKDTDKTALQIWAENNPALAQKEYLKKAFNTDGTPKILDKTEEGFDKPNAPGVVESIDGMQLPNSISIDAANELLDNMAKAGDDQALLNKFIMAMQNN